MTKGTFKWYSREKGYGFILAEDSKDYFVHYSQLPQDQQDIKEDDKIEVEFEIKEFKGREQAQEVKFVNSSSESSDEEE